MLVKWTLWLSTTVCALSWRVSAQTNGLAYKPAKAVWSTCAPRDRVLAEFNNNTIDTCVAQCLDSPDCTAVNYHRVRGTCLSVQSVDDGTQTAEDVPMCPGYIHIKRDSMRTDSPSQGTDNDQICPLTALATYGNCTIFGNMMLHGSNVRLQCPMYWHRCKDTVFVCGTDREWTFETCLEELIMVVKVSSLPCRYVTDRKPDRELRELNDTVQAIYPDASYTNVVLGKTIQMSSQFGTISPGSLLMDGNRSPYWPCASTSRMTNPWMVIDLGQAYTITHIFMVNRLDCCAERLHDVRILLGPSTDSLREYVHIPGRFGAFGTITLAYPVVTRFVRITVPGVEHLTICELEAWNVSSTPE